MFKADAERTNEVVAGATGGGRTALTRREWDVLDLLGRGCSYQQIALRLGISVHTVTSHIKNCYRKLDVHSAAAAVMRSVQLRLHGEA
jgi:DNA-binding NarL/FixJ family response regulator